MSIYDKLFYLGRGWRNSVGDEVMYKSANEWKPAVVVEVENPDKNIYIVNVDGQLIRTNKIVPKITEDLLREIVKTYAEILKLDILIFERDNIRTDTSEVLIFVKGEEESEDKFTPLDAVATNKKTAYILLIDLIYELATKANEVSLQ